MELFYAFLGFLFWSVTTLLPASDPNWFLCPDINNLFAWVAVVITYSSVTTYAGFTAFQHGSTRHWDPSSCLRNNYAVNVFCPDFLKINLDGPKNKFGLAVWKSCLFSFFVCCLLEGSGSVKAGGGGNAREIRIRKTKKKGRKDEDSDEETGPSQQSRVTTTKQFYVHRDIVSLDAQ